MLRIKSPISKINYQSFLQLHIFGSIHRTVPLVGMSLTYLCISSQIITTRIYERNLHQNIATMGIAKYKMLQ